MAEERRGPGGPGGPGRGPGRGPGAMRGPRPKLENPGKILTRTLSYIFKNYLFHCIFCVICIIVSVEANVQGTMFTKNLIDEYIMPMVQTKLAGGAVSFTPLFKAMARVACFYLLGAACAYGQAIVMMYVSQGTMMRLRNDLFTHMESLPIKYFDTHAHGDIMSIYTNDIDTLRELIGRSFPQILNSTISVVSYLISMLVLSVPLTFINMLLVAVMLLISSKIAATSGKNYVAQQRALGKLNGYIEETMDGQKVEKVFCHEDIAVREFNELNDSLFDAAFHAAAYANYMGPINAQLGHLNYVICAVVGGAFAINGISGLTLGGLVSFLTFSKNFNMPISQISQQMSSIFMALAGADRVFKLMDAESEQDDGYVTLVRCIIDEDGTVHESEQRTGTWAWKHNHKDGTLTYVPQQGQVEFENVDFGYNPEKIVLHDVTLYAKPGQKIAFVGSTGAGKTTITNLINRFYDIQDGKIRYDGINIQKIKKPDLRRSLGMVLQDTHLFTGTIMENIRFGKLDATDDECIAAAKLAGADRFIRHLPEGYNTVLTGDGANLSQGQRQLLSIARAAVADPPALILDEATSSIDTRTERIVQEGMDRLMKGRTTFVIAHRLSTVQNADCIMVLEQGRIIERGTHDQLIEQKGKYYQLYTGKFE